MQNSVARKNQMTEWNRTFSSYRRRAIQEDVDWIRRALAHAKREGCDTIRMTCFCEEEVNDLRAALSDEENKHVLLPWPVFVARPTQCGAVWRAGIIQGPGSTPNGARCSLTVHDESIPHSYE